MVFVSEELSAYIFRAECEEANGLYRIRSIMRREVTSQSHDMRR
jgi:hypothetical protein